MSLSVLMFCPQFRPRVGGAERQAEKLSAALVRAGVRVRIITPLLYPDSPLEEVLDGVVVRRFPLVDLTRRFPWMRGLGGLNLWNLRRQIMAAVDGELDGVDLLHCHIASAQTAFAMEAAQRRGLPVACKVAVAGERSDLEEVEATGLGGRTIARSMVARMDHWIATTLAVADALKRWGVPEARITNIPNGVEVQKTGAAPPAPARHFLYLGRLSTNIRRDVPTLIAAFDRLADKHPDVELAIVGDGDLLAETRALVAACRHAGRITLPGLQPPAEWLEWADAFVLPSRREGLSNALLEAMAAGLACVANDIPANREVLADGEAGLLTPVGDAQALFESLDSLAANPDRASALRQAANDHAWKRFSIESVAGRHLALYEALAAGSTP